MKISFEIFLILYQSLNSIASISVLTDRTVTCKNARVSERDIARAFFTESLGWQRPLIYGTNALTVNVSLVVTSISEIIEKDRTVKFIGHLSMSWQDQFHAWQHSFPHNCIDYVVLRPGDKVWIPDLSQPFSENKNNLMTHPGERIRIHSDGFTSFSPGGSISALCEFDLSYFPFDYQKCTVRLESWKYTHKHLRLAFAQPPIHIKQWHENEIWRLVSSHNYLSRVIYTDSDNAYDRMEFVFMLKRKASFYVCSIVVPNYLLSLGILSTFALPLVDASRLQIAFTCLFAHSLFQLFLITDLPRSSDNYPLLAMFIDLQMVYVVIVIAGLSFILLFMRWADPGQNFNCINEDGSFDNAKLEATLTMPLKCYNSICTLGKVLRIEPPFSMVFGGPPKQSSYMYPVPKSPKPWWPFKKPKHHQQNLAFPGGPPASPFPGRSSSNSLAQDGKSSPKLAAQQPGSSIWAFCPTFFTSQRGSVAAYELPDSTGRMAHENVNLLEAGVPSTSANSSLSPHLGVNRSSSVKPGSTGGAVASSGPMPSPGPPRSPAAVAAATALDQATTRLLLDFKKKIWFFYARVLNRLTLSTYLCFIILTPFFMALVSATTWRDVKK